MSMPVQSAPKRFASRRYAFEKLEGRCLLAATPLETAFSQANIPEAMPVDTASLNWPTGSKTSLENMPSTLAVASSFNDFTVRIRAQATDASGNPLTQINVGDEFWLRVFVQDARQGGAGVFGSYVNVAYSPRMAETTGQAQFAYPNGKHAELVPGQIWEAGAFASLTPLDTSVHLLFSVPMKAVHAGELFFDPYAADGEGWNTLVFGEDYPIATSRIDYQPATLTVVPLADATGSEPILNDEQVIRQHRPPAPPRPIQPPTAIKPTAGNVVAEPITPPAENSPAELEFAPLETAEKTERWFATQTFFLLDDLSFEPMQMRAEFGNSDFRSIPNILRYSMSVDDLVSREHMSFSTLSSSTADLGKSDSEFTPSAALVQIVPMPKSASGWTDGSTPVEISRMTHDAAIKRPSPDLSNAQIQRQDLPSAVSMLRGTRQSRPKGSPQADAAPTTQGTLPS